jgi:hypothetical protein
MHQNPPEDLDDFEDEFDDEESDSSGDYDPNRFDRRQINRALGKLAMKWSWCCTIRQNFTTIARTVVRLAC